MSKGCSFSLRETKNWNDFKVLLLQLEIRGIKLGVVVGWVGDSGRRVEAGRK